MPWILPEGNNKGAALASTEKALAAGMTYRPLKTTMVDILDWWNSDGVTDEMRAKFLDNKESVYAREEAILAAWKARNEA